MGLAIEKVNEINFFSHLIFFSLGAFLGFMGRQLKMEFLEIELYQVQTLVHNQLPMFANKAQMLTLFFFARTHFYT